MAALTIPETTPVLSGRGDPSTETSLDHAVVEAVEAGREGFVNLQRHVNGIAAHLASQRVALARVLSKAKRGDDLDAETREVLETLQADIDGLLCGIVADLKKHIERRQRSIGVVRGSLYGRTGSGKSTQAEGMTHGNGASVSDGRSGYTDEEQEFTYGPLKIVDTPGIEVLRRDIHERHEAEARDSVLASDFVILLFDTQNQKIGEFEKISRVVKELDRPAIAVMNVRNPLYRRTDRPEVVTKAARLVIAKQVQGHFDQVRNRPRSGLPLSFVNQ